MAQITIYNLDENIKDRLEKQAEEHGRSLEEEAKEIIREALTEDERRFAHCGDFEIPEISREPITTRGTK